MDPILQTLAIPASLLVFGSGLSWFISSQFTSVRKLIHEETNKTKLELINKLDYHEQHDDRRFDSITKDLWEIRVGNAARDSVYQRDKKEKMKNVN